MMEDFWNTDNFFEKPFFNGEKLPAVNIRETKDNYEVEVAVPGFKKDDFKVTTENGLLTISAETKFEKNEEKENYTRQEFSCSSFARSFSLPENVVEEDISANYHDGLLKIELKKSVKNLPPKKEVKVK
jgi:HSP20 family protein